MERNTKYEDALERCKKEFNFNNLAYSHEEIKQRLERVFPELKESDDEKIRKALINVFSTHQDYEVYYGVSVEDIRAWLEKQGEQKPNFCHHEVDLSDCSEEYRKAYYDGWNNCNQQHAQLEAEQKPAWSEEDEIRAAQIISDLEKCTVPGFPVYIGGVELEINWLKSLKERYTWKPSDEQIEAFEHFVRSMGESGYASPYDNNTKLLYSLLSDLKKLKVNKL